MANQSSFNLSTNSTGPVECLGQTFPSDQARRDHYLKLLAEKLKNPDFRKIEGFPVGDDTAILALSDPPYYTACPNPWTGDFIKCYGTPYDPKRPYHREPFAADVSEGKNHPLYKAHSYYTKVPHQAIVPYVLHYTEPGDTVLDAFSGTGMTGVAVKACSTQAHEERESIEKAFFQGSSRSPQWGERLALLNDLSPYASFVTYNYTAPADYEHAARLLAELLSAFMSEHGQLYTTRAESSDISADVDYFVWSEVYRCPNCSNEFAFVDAAYDIKTKRVSLEFSCPKCTKQISKDSSELVFESYLDRDLGRTAKRPKRKLAIVAYKLHGDRYEKRADPQDVATAERAEQLSWGFPIPTKEFDFPKTWEATRLKSRGISHTHHLFLGRPRILLSFLWRRANELEEPRTRKAVQFIVEQGIRNFSIMNSFEPLAFSQNARGQKSAYYVPSQHSEVSPSYFFKGKISGVLRAFSDDYAKRSISFVSTGTAAKLLIPNNSIDYIFTDPPFGENFPYSELNFFIESWHQVWSEAKSDAVVDRRKQDKTSEKTLEDYQGLLRSIFREYYRVLKPGRWASIVFSNTQASVWNAIQTALQEAGFVVANVSALDKQQGSFKAVTTTTAVKQDLVISAYKPNGGLEARFARTGASVEGIWDFMRTHLRNLPVVKAKGGQLERIAERDPRILYDRMVAFYVGHSTPVPLSSAEFQAELSCHFVERDGMWFLPEQVSEYDKKRAQMENVGQMAIFVEDEKSAIDWIRNELKDKPRTTQDIQPDFMQRLSASWKKWEARPELKVLLDQNFLCYDGTGEVPSQIHSYLSTQFKELRNLPKDHAQLRQKAKDRWYVPDPKKNVDVETLRNKRLLEEFWSYLPDGYISAARSPDRNPTLPMPGMAAARPKVPRSKKLKQVRTEAVRVGFKFCYQQKDYPTILAVADMLPESVLNEDEQLQMIYDNAALRAEAAT